MVLFKDLQSNHLINDVFDRIYNQYPKLTDIITFSHCLILRIGGVFLLYLWFIMLDKVSY